MYAYTLIACYIKLAYLLGLATRRCSSDTGQWEEPDVTNCSNFQEIENNVSIPVARELIMTLSICSIIYVHTVYTLSLVCLCIHI